jgi:hypothetical protein
MLDRLNAFNAKARARMRCRQQFACLNRALLAVCASVTAVQNYRHREPVRRGLGHHRRQPDAQGASAARRSAVRWRLTFLAPAPAQIITALVMATYAVLTRSRFGALPPPRYRHVCVVSRSFRRAGPPVERTLVWHSVLTFPNYSACLHYAHLAVAYLLCARSRHRRASAVCNL